MASAPELVPPCSAVIAIAVMELFFPEDRIERDLRGFEKSFKNASRFKSMKSMVIHLARGWQVTVDLVYTILAGMTLLVSRVVATDLPATRPVFWILVVILLLNVVLLVVCATIGPEKVVAMPIPLPFGSWFTLRQISIGFVILSNVLVMLGIGYEIWRFPAQA